MKEIIHAQGEEGDKMEDWEKDNLERKNAEELKRQNDLLEEQNRLREDEKLRADQEQRQHEETLRTMQNLEEEKRVAQFEREMDNRIYKLKLDIAKTKDEDTKFELQCILDEEEQKKENYYRQKEERRQAALAAYEARQEELRRQESRQKVFSVVRRALVVLVILIVLFVGSAWYFSSSGQETVSSFGSETANSTSGSRSSSTMSSSKMSSSSSRTSSSQVRQSITPSSSKTASQKNSVTSQPIGNDKDKTKVSGDSQVAFPTTPGVPSELVGTWYGEWRQQGGNIEELTMTFSKDGKVTLVGSKGASYQATVERVEKVGDNTYHYILSSDSNFRAVFPSQGIEDSRTTTEYGVKISDEGDFIEPTIWSAAKGSTIDYTSGHPLTPFYESEEELLEGDY